MPITTIPFRPGINRELTNYSNKGGFYNSEKIRFRNGSPEKLGGWINANASATFNGVARSFTAWETSDGTSLIGFGTNQKYYIVGPNTATSIGNTSNIYNDVTPVNPLISGTVTLGATPFTTVSGSPLVNVVDTNYVLLTTGTFINFTSTTTANGVTINGPYEIIAFTANGYQIVASTNATSSGSFGTSVTLTYSVNAVSGVDVLAAGWGVGTWGSGTWGIGATLSNFNVLQVWSQANFGNDLLSALSGGALYYWTYTNASTFNPAVTINAKAGLQIKTTQTVAASVTASNTFTILNAQGVDYGAIVSGTGIPANTYVTSNYTGYTTVTVSNNVTLTAGQQVNFSYSQYCAPTQVGQIIVSPTNQFTVALGSTPYNPYSFSPSFSPLLVRWSDQSVPWEWTPATYNQSGQQSLSVGSYIVGGLNTRQEILIWTDRALYSMQYVGAPFVFTFNLMMDNISLIGQNAAISVNGATYWMGNDKFYIYNGTVTTLPCTVRKFVFSNINVAQAGQVVCGQNEQYNEIWWFYPSIKSPINDSYVIYNYAENLWYYGTLNRTAWLQSSLFVWPMAIFSLQTTYLYNSISASGATLLTFVNGGSYPVSGTVKIDNEYISYTGLTSYSSGSTFYPNTYQATITGRGLYSTTTAAHGAYTKINYIVPNQITFQDNGIDDNTQLIGIQPFTSYLQTADFDINGGDHFGYVWRFLPDFTFQGSTAGTPSIVLTINARNSSGSSYLTSTGGDEGNTITNTDGTVNNTQSAPIPPNTYPVEQYTGVLYTRIRGRQMNFTITSSGQTGVFWQMGTQRFDVRPDGRR